MKKKIIFIAKKNHYGFTLIELLVTIFLVGVGLVGVVSFLNSNIASQNETKNELIAAELAQEETEIVRNIIDYNYLKGDSWYKGVTNKNATSNQCQAVDYNDLTDHSGHICTNRKKICINTTTLQYYQCDDNNANFSRQIDLKLDNTSGSDLDSGGCIKVTTTVSWSDKQTIANDIICKPRS